MINLRKKLIWLETTVLAILFTLFLSACTLTNLDLNDDDSTPTPIATPVPDSFQEVVFSDPNTPFNVILADVNGVTQTITIDVSNADINLSNLGTTTLGLNNLENNDSFNFLLSFMGLFVTTSINYNDVIYSDVFVTVINSETLVFDANSFDLTTEVIYDPITTFYVVNLELTADITIDNIVESSTLEYDVADYSTITLETLTVTLDSTLALLIPDDSLLIGDASYSLTVITSVTVYGHTVTLTESSDIVYLDSNQAVITPLYFQDSSGDILALSQAMADQLIALGITLTPITLVFDGSNSYTVTSSVSKVQYDDITTISIINNTLYNTTVNLYAAYGSLTLATVSLSADTLVTTQQHGITIGFDANSQLAYGIFSPPNSKTTLDYNTIEYQNQSGLAAINATEAYQRGYFGEGVTVAVVDSGINTTITQLAANIVGGVRLNGFVGGTAIFSTISITDPTGHGTQVAAVIGAVVDDTTIHGVAPLVKLLPVQTQASNTPPNDTLNAVHGFHYLLTTQIANEHVQIINNSWGAAREKLYGTYDGNTVFFEMPARRVLLNANPKYDYLINATTGYFTTFGKAASNNDVVAVFAAGNDGWNAENNELELCDVAVLADDVFCGYEQSNANLTISNLDLFLDFEALAHTVELVKSNNGTNITLTTEFYGYGVLGTLDVEANSPSAYNYAPWYAPSLIGKFVAVVATDTNGNIASFSNGCGDTKAWCLAAPGEDIQTIDSNDALALASGTSMAAAHVSGALAVLKSRFPAMPMSVVLAIIFATAEDKGATGIDTLYGHGLLDLGAAIAVQGSVKLALPSGDTSEPFAVISDTLVGDIYLAAPNAKSGIDHNTTEYQANAGLGAIGVAEASSRGYFGQGVRVALVDRHFLYERDIVNRSINTVADLANSIYTPAISFDSVAATILPSDTAFAYEVVPISQYGTAPAGILAANAGNADIQGVALSVSMLPVATSYDLYNDDDAGSDTRRFSAIEYLLAADNAQDTRQPKHVVDIINNSWSSRLSHEELTANRWGLYTDTDNTTITVLLNDLPVYKALLDSGDSSKNDISLGLFKNASDQKRNLTAFFADIATAIADDDIVMVMAGGESGWNENGSITGCTGDQISFDNDAPDSCTTSNITLDVSDIATNLSLNGLGNIDANAPGAWALAPLYAEEFIGKYVVVMGVDQSDAKLPLIDSSNGCGIAKDWCLVAPAQDLSVWRGDYSFDLDNNTVQVTTDSGNYLAAPHVSGALALLKSRLPSMPMSVVLEVLLGTADDLGASGVDDIYGHGMVNVSAAINAQGDVVFASYDIGYLPAPNAKSDTDYNTTEYQANAGLGAIGVAEASSRGYFGQGVRVALVDRHFLYDGHGVVNNNNAKADPVADLADSIYTFGIDGDFSDGFVFSSRGHEVVITREISQYGTAPAGILAANAGNADIQGVALSVSMLPVATSFDAYNDTVDVDSARFSANQYLLQTDNALDKSIKSEDVVDIINNSWSSRYSHEDNTANRWGLYTNSNNNTVTVLLNDLPVYKALLDSGDSSKNDINLNLQDDIVNYDLTAFFADIGAGIVDDDIVMVMAGGESGWNENGSVTGCTGDQISFNNNAPDSCDTSNITLDVSDIATNLSLNGLGNIAANAPGAWALAPLYAEEFIGKYVVVMGVDQSDANLPLIDSSNGCGIAKDWCLVAPAQDLSVWRGDYSLDVNNNTVQVTTDSGNYLAAPHVSGALALLKSRLPSMPMNIVLEVLLGTAYDLGAAGVDDIYGHGMVNVSAAINAQGNVVFASYDIGYIPALPAPNAKSGIDHNTTEYQANAGLGAIGVAEASSRGYFGQGVRVALVDRHFLYDGDQTNGSVNPVADLANSIYTPGITSDPIGNDAAIELSRDLILQFELSQISQYGTAPAGILAANAGNADIQGVALSVSMLPVAISFDAYNTFTDPDIRRFVAIEYLLAADNAESTRQPEHVVDIINNSWSHRYSHEELTANRWGLYTDSDNTTVTVLLNDLPVYKALLDSGDSSKNDINLDLSGDVNNRKKNLASFFANMATAIADDDVVMVMAGGESGWNENGSITGCTGDQISFNNNGPNSCTTSNITLDVSDIATNLSLNGLGNIAANAPGAWALAPLYAEELIGKYVVVMGVDQSDANLPLIDSSNGCGIAKDWCLVAPAQDLSVWRGDYPSDVNNNTVQVTTDSGNYLAAPHVSGALALLKSRLPSMPMNIVLELLLGTADDLGAAGVDDIYGHGMVNVSAAINAQGVVVFADYDQSDSNVVNANNVNNANNANNALVFNSFSSLSKSLGGLAAELANVEVAVEYLEGRYYNMALSGLLESVATDSLPSIGNGADDLLTEATRQQTMLGNWYINQHSASGQLLNLNYSSDYLRASYELCSSCDDVSSSWDGYGLTETNSYVPYFSETDQHALLGIKPIDGMEVFAGIGFSDDVSSGSTYSQWGIRLSDSTELSQNNRLSWHAEYAQIQEQGTLLGNTLNGGLGVEEGMTHQTKLGASLGITRHWTINGELEVGQGSSTGASGSLVSELDYNYQGYYASLEGTSLFKTNDLMRFGIKQSSTVNDGSLTLNKSVLIDGVLQSNSETIDWSNSPTTTYQWGYRITNSATTSMGFAIEHTTNKTLGSESAASWLVKWSF